MDLYPKVLIRPICGCCGHPMILGRSVGKYQSFFCMNASSGIKGFTNRGYKSARIVDEAVLRTVMATLYTDDFIADLTADVNKRLAWIARLLTRAANKGSWLAIEVYIFLFDRQPTFFRSGWASTSKSSAQS